LNANFQKSKNELRPQIPRFGNLDSLAMLVEIKVLLQKCF